MSQFISLQKAMEMTTLYRKEKEVIIAREFKGKDLLARCETFDRDIFDVILAKPACKGIRVYYGMDEGLKVHAIIVGVNDKDEDILPAITAELTEGDGDIGEDAKRCPTDCPPPSALNP